ncbi:hypothetical protein EVG20_g8554 [Dentipellis fragilis]|uniref:Transcription factor domain-containing protein n=1 Tax=Dentipellis fragilis TaxID=205917 RepID=A0A4Y9Y689_9AGAM|nr:hypothetical protein EVG20_g8554 [Dentipellis fragilis]
MQRLNTMLGFEFGPSRAISQHELIRARRFFASVRLRPGQGEDKAVGSRRRMARGDLGDLKDGEVSSVRSSLICLRLPRALIYCVPPPTSQAFPQPAPMPVDVSKPPAQDRRRVVRRDQDGPRDSSYAREIELKRNRGEISCAECRRCDDRVPALVARTYLRSLRLPDSKSSATSKFHANLARYVAAGSRRARSDRDTLPSGGDARPFVRMVRLSGSFDAGGADPDMLLLQAAWPPARVLGVFVIAATEHLHRRVARMSDRIRQLEDALAVLQSTHSQEQHPLLRESMTVHDLDKTDEPALEPEEGEGPAEVVKAFGTMSISEHGVSRFFGPTGGSEGLLLYDGEDSTASPSSSHQTDSTRDSRSPAIPSAAARFSHAFPFTPVGPSETVYSLIQGQLPSWEEALRTSEVYLQNASWLFRSMSRTQLMDEMLPVMYGKKAAGPPPEDEYSGAHDLALLLYVFAVGRIVDLDLSHTDAEAQGEHFHQLAKAALCLQPVLERPSMVTIQALHVGSIYNAMCGSEISGGESTMERTDRLARAVRGSRRKDDARSARGWRVSDRGKGTTRGAPTQPLVARSLALPFAAVYAVHVSSPPGWLGDQLAHGDWLLGALQRPQIKQRDSRLSSYYSTQGRFLQAPRHRAASDRTFRNRLRTTPSFKARG